MKPGELHIIMRTRAISIGIYRMYSFPSQYRLTFRVGTSEWGFAIPQFISRVA